MEIPKVFIEGYVASSYIFSLFRLVYI